jgi:hypothetical protein
MQEENELIKRIHDFMAHAPLYATFDPTQVPGWDERHSPTFKGNNLSLPKVFRFCNKPACKTNRPFERVDLIWEKPVNQSESDQASIYSYHYRCTGCGNDFWCWVQPPEEGETKWLKVGQVPPYDISIASALQNALGQDDTLYKRAQICMSQSFGIAACSYLRRLLENQVTPLLELVYEARKEESEDVEDLSQILNERIAEKKIRLANQVLPSSLAVAGDNPLELIYDQLSVGLHRQSEQECMEIASEASKVLEHVIISINDEYERRQSKSRYVEMIRELRKRGG